MVVHQDARLVSVLRASAPATLNQMAAPIAMALQLAMFGHFLSTESVAAWIAIGATVQFVAGLANFLLVVSMARVSHALGAKDWAVLCSTVRYALVAACTVGVAAATLLLLLRQRVLALMGLSEATAAAYYLLAVGRLPFLMLLRTASGVTVGYQRLGVAAAVQATPRRLHRAHTIMLTPSCSPHPVLIPCSVTLITSCSTRIHPDPPVAGQRGSRGRRDGCCLRGACLAAARLARRRVGLAARRGVRERRSTRHHLQAAASLHVHCMCATCTCTCTACALHAPACALHVRCMHACTLHAMHAARCTQAGDLMQDLKTGHLLGASPRAQFFAQLIGSTASIFVTVAAFNLYATAYGCQTTATWSCEQFQA